MRASDAAVNALDVLAGSVAADSSAASDLFQVADLLTEQPMLRRSLSDPSATPDQRRALAARLFGGKIAPSAMQVVDGAVGHTWGGPQRLVRGIERQGVRLALRTAQDEGRLDTVTAELNTLSDAVLRTPEINDILRDRAVPVGEKQKLIASLAKNALPVTRQLLSRTADGGARGFDLKVTSYLDMAAELTHRAIAKVVVARPLDDARVTRLQRALQAQTGRGVLLQIDVDPSVLGGMSVQIDDEVIESTVAARLDDARRHLTNL
ncbi:MAG TPA: F0F1 ATP synthase subunit delta [Arachnia sp.]|nr:F0F1 ATP synthase subunit delta [Arachnia sp.]HMT87583.1 F0F1 ATP synthase subunit delta [Arachnia sp.]